MARYRLRLTKAADQDLADLYREGLTTWGMEQADQYYDGLLNRFARMCETPEMYPAVNDIRPGYRRSVYEKHSIYFVIDDGVLEVRAVVKWQDISGRL